MEEPAELKNYNLFVVGFIFELALVGVAAIIGYVATGYPFPFKLELDLRGLWLGLLATIPPVIFALFSTSRVGTSLSSLRGVYDRVKTILGEPLLRMSELEMFLLAAAAGIGEEVLFRGVIQGLFADPMWGLAITSVIFGLLHALTVMYFLIATVIGVYLGWLYQTTDHLLVPIVVHWLYDAVALFLFRRRFRKESLSGKERQEDGTIGNENGNG